MVVRPAPPRSVSTPRSTPRRIQVVIASSSSVVSFVFSLGGISPRTSMEWTFSQVALTLGLTRSGAGPSSRMSPFGFSAPWQETQCFASSGLTTRSKSIGCSARTGGTPAASSAPRQVDVVLELAISGCSRLSTIPSQQLLRSPCHRERPCAPDDSQRAGLLSGWTRSANAGNGRVMGGTLHRRVTYRTPVTELSRRGSPFILRTRSSCLQERLRHPHPVGLGPPVVTRVEAERRDRPRRAGPQLAVGVDERVAAVTVSLTLDHAVEAMEPENWRVDHSSSLHPTRHDRQTHACLGTTTGGGHSSAGMNF